MVAGLCFILPAVFITGIFALLYKQYGALPSLQPFIYGIKPAIIGIILAAVFPLAKKSIRSIELGVAAVLVLTLSLFGVNEIILMFGTGLFFLMISYLRNRDSNKTLSFVPFSLVLLSKPVLFAGLNLNLFLIFLKIGAILYGSGYVLFAFLDAELVTTGLLSREQLIDAIAVGQFTPGPVFSSVTFIGFQINGFWGAVVATVGIFLPSFLFVSLLNPLVKKMRNSKLFSSFLDVINVASVAIIAAVCVIMGAETITDWRTVLIATISTLVAFGFRKINSAFVVIGGSLTGYILWLI